MAVQRELYSVIVKPVYTEKTSNLQGKANTYAFQISEDANKGQVKAAVEAIFNVKVDSVRTMQGKGEQRRNRFGNYRTTGVRKAYVRLKDGYAIEMA